jgi:hypothetical protein
VISAAPLPEGWTEDASWLLQAIDPRARLVRLVRMDEAAYRAASFLDDRMLNAGLEMRLCSLDQAMADADSLKREDARWIFHIGHVGSTLVSRLLGELDRTLSLREPRSLRDLSESGGDELARFARNLRRVFSCSFSRSQRTIVKATSFVSEHAPLLVPANGTALFLYASPQNYIAGILAGEYSVKELAAGFEGRTGRLRDRRIELIGFDASLAHRAAAAWACEMTSLESACDVMRDRRLLWADFDVMLQDMTGWIRRCAKHFDLKVTPSKAAELANGPLMRRYSKALEYDYSPSLRAELLAEAASRHRADIEAAVEDLGHAAKSTPLLERALRRSGQEF